MRMPNLNKLFPRLTIRVKLAIAFVAVAALPLGVLAAVTVVTTVTQLRRIAESSVLHDLETVARDTERALEYLERDVEFLGTQLQVEGGARDVSRFLALSPALFRLRVVGLDGGILRSMAAESRFADAADDATTPYYVIRARELRPGERVVLPVEVRSPNEGSPPVSAVAVIAPVDGPSGLEAVIVGEAYSDRLFHELRSRQALVQGTTLVADSTGMVLFRSDRASSWERFITSELVGMGLPQLQGLDGQRPGLWHSEGHLVGQVTLQFGSAPSAPRLALLRVVPDAVINGPARGFLVGAGVSALVIILLVLGLAYLAARELTRPIYQLSFAARELAQGGPPQAVPVESNDELEDLARDFHDMALVLDGHRRGLERVVGERTQALQQTHAELVNVVAHAGDGIVVLDPQGRVRLWSGGAQRLFGWTTEEAVGQDGADLLTPPGSGVAEEMAFIARELERRGSVVNLRTRRRHRSGELLEVSLTQSVIRDDGAAPHGQVLIVRDASLQARLEAQMRRSERLAAVSVMAAGLAHELNNPLAILGNRIEIMLAELVDDPDPVRFSRDLGVMRAHLSRLSALTRDLLRFAREDDDPIRPTPLEELVQRATGLVERTLLSRGAVLEQDLAPGLPPVAVRPRAVETVLLNLVLNAADAMADGGGGTITIVARPSQSPAWVEVAVIDEGPGIPPDLQERIFEPFFTTKAPGKGTGLGLAVCRSTIESHGGELTVSSQPHRGTRFHMTLPVAMDAT